MSKNKGTTQEMCSGIISQGAKYDEKYRKLKSNDTYLFDLWKLCYELNQGYIPGLDGEKRRHSSNEIYAYLILNQKRKDIKAIMPNGAPNPGRIRERIRFFKDKVVIKDRSSTIAIVIFLFGFCMLGPLLGAVYAYHSEPEFLSPLVEEVK